jgi:hypothetical protein
VVRELAAPYDGSCNPNDIRTFYTSELAFLRATQKRYACQFCGTSAGECPGCRDLRKRIEALDKPTVSR